MDRDRLTIRDVVAADLDAMSWLGSPTHLRTMAEWLGRVASGVVDYLCVCGPADIPLAMGGASYVTRPGRAEIWQLATMPALQSLGLGTLLIGALEDRARDRGFTVAMLLVEDDNPRALGLYRRLGYAVVGEEVAVGCRGRRRPALPAPDDVSSPGAVPPIGALPSRPNRGGSQTTQWSSPKVLDLIL